MGANCTRIDMVLKDQHIMDDAESRPKTDVRLENINDSIWISVKGYEDQFGCGAIITLEIWEGRLRLLVWADRNREDPTHIIDLEGAKNETQTAV